MCWESETGFCLSSARTALRQENRSNARKKATLLRKMQPKDKNPDDLRGWRPSLLSIEEQEHKKRRAQQVASPSPLSPLHPCLLDWCLSRCGRP